MANAKLILILAMAMTSEAGEASNLRPSPRPNSNGSSRKCVDRYKNCQRIKEIGACRNKDPAEQKRIESYCAKTCRFCDEKDIEQAKCIDIYENCQRVKAAGGCKHKDTIQLERVRKNCPMTCGFCATCSNPLGMQSGEIKDDQLVSISEYEDGVYVFAAKYARLNRTDYPQGFRGIAEKSFLPWIKVTLLRETVITGISTQGYGGEDDVENWVRRYYIQTQASGKKSGRDFKTVTDENGVVKIFPGNTDKNSIVYNAFDFPQSAKVVKITFTEYHKQPGFRFELYGCIMEMSFELWIKLKNKTFNQDLFSKKSAKYDGLRNRVINEVKSLLEDKRGFLFAELIKFSPGSVIVELRIGTVKRYKEELISAIKTGILGDNKVGIDPEYLVFRDPKGNVTCQTPNITLTGVSQDLDSPIKIARSRSCIIFAQVKDNCLISDRVKLNWYVSKRNGVVFGELTKIERQRESRRWGIKERSLEYGVYYVKVEVIMADVETVRNYAFGFFEIVASNLTAKISTGSLIIQGLNKTVIFDASGSVDPDVLPATTDGMSFLWLCRRESEPSPRDFMSTSHLGGGGGCYGNGPERLNSTGVRASLDATRLELGVTYVVEVQVTKGERTARAVHHFNVTKGELLTIQIRCREESKRNCSNKPNPTHRIGFVTLCTGMACRGPLTYKWSLYVRIGSADYKRKPFLENTNANGEAITLQPGTLEEGNKYKIVVEVDSTRLGITKLFYEEFKTNMRPYGGRCEADRSSGEALRTDFKFNCTGWQDDPEDLPLTYEFGYQSPSGIANVLQISEKSSAVSKLALGDPARNFTLQMIIRVKDKYGFFNESKFEIQVRQRSMENATRTLRKLAVGDDSNVGTLLSQGNVKGATQLASAVLSVLSADSNDDFKLKEKIQIKESVIEHMSKVNVTDNIESLIQVASVVAGVTENENELSQLSQEKSVSVLETMTSAFKQISKGKRSDPSNRMKAGNNLLHGIGNVLFSSSSRAKITEDEISKPPDEAVAMNKKKNKEMARKAFHLISEVSESLQSSRKINDEPIKMQTKTLSLVLERKHPTDIGNKTVAVGESTVDLPPASMLLANLRTNCTFVDTQMVSIKTNPFTWDVNAQVIKSPVISIDLKDNSGKVINVSGLSKEIELKFPTPSPLEAEELHYFTNGTEITYHQVNISSKAMTVRVRIVPEHKKELLIYLQYKERPTSRNFSYSAKVPDLSSCDRDREDWNYTSCTSDPFLIIFTSNVTGHTGLHYLGIQHATSDDEFVLTRRRRSLCSGNGRSKRSIICNEFKDPPTTPVPTPLIVKPEYDPATDINYTIAISMATCKYWAEDENIWTSKGCRIGPNSTTGTLQCFCTHLSSFGGDFFVAPNPIDFDKVFLEFMRLGETGNFVVLTTVCVIFGVYILAAVFARRADTNDKEKVTESIPLGNCGDNMHLFEITVYTGIWRRCGTTANVAINIYGDQRDSDVIPLTCSAMCAKKLFQRGSVHTFVLPLAKMLGDITHIKIWHDNSGKNPSWFLRQVVIRDIKNDAKWFFVNNRWLAVEKDDGNIERVLYVSSEKEIHSFRNKFFTRTANGLGDGHIWLSVITRPPSSHFTRLQRLSCCLSVFMSAMIANAMFYRFGAEADSTFSLGPLVVSWDQIIIGIQSSFIVVPVNVLIVSIFRNIKPKNSSEEQVYNVNEDKPAKKKKRSFAFPQWCVYIAWALCLATSLVSATFTVFYSLQWGKETSNQWLTSVLVSFSQDIIVIQPIKVLLVACLLSLILKKAPEDEHVTKVESNGATYSKVQGEHKEPVQPKKEELTKFREYRVRVLAMARTLLEAFFYLTFAWMLLILVYGNRDTNRYNMTKNVRELLPRFGKVRNITSFWDWAESRMVPGLYKTVWYNGKQFEYKEGFVSNRLGYIVGMPRLRQLRVKQGPCPIGNRYPDLSNEESVCQPEYSLSREDTTIFNRPKWIPLEVNHSMFLSEFELYEICPRPWRYRDYTDLDTLPYQGIQALYGGGGYVADLGYTASAATRIIKNLRENNWIDTRTRAVFVEILIHEPATKLFSAVTYLVEFLATGNAITYHKINTMALYGANASGFQSFYALCELFVILVVIFLTVSECVKLYRWRCQYFKSPWSYVELAQISCALSTIVLSIFRRYHTSRLVNKVHDNPFKTTSFHYAVIWSEVETILIAVLVFIITIKLLKILKFNEQISTLASSMKHSFKNLTSYAIVFLVVFFAFAQVAYLVFGATVQSYSSITGTMRAQFAMFIGGPLSYFELKASNRILGPLFFFTFITTMATILVNMFLAILNEGYRDVKLFPEKFSDDRKMVMFFKDYAKWRLIEYFRDLRSTKMFPKSSKYEVQYHKIDFDDMKNDLYRSLDCWNSEELDKIRANEDAVEATFFSELKKTLRDIRAELKEFKVFNRSKKYKMQKEYEKNVQFNKDEGKAANDFCVGVLYKTKPRLSFLRLDQLHKGHCDCNEMENLLPAENDSSSDEETIDESTPFHRLRESTI